MRGGSLEGHWEKIARTFSRSWGIRVVLSGTACHFDGSGTIRIPANADHLKEADQRILEGMLDHEWGHAAEEVEAKEKGWPSIFTVLGRQKSNAMMILVNAFEDIRIETKNGSKYVGVAENLKHMNKFMVGHLEKDARAGLVSNWQAFYCGIISRHYGEKPGWIPQPIADIIDRMEDIIAEAPKALHAGESEELAKRVMARLSDILKDAERTDDEKTGLPVEQMRQKPQPKKPDARESDSKPKSKAQQKQEGKGEKQAGQKAEQKAEQKADKTDKDKSSKPEKQPEGKAKESAKPSRGDDDDNDGGDEEDKGAPLDGDDEGSEDSDDTDGDGAGGDEDEDADDDESSEEGGGEEGSEGEDFEDQDFDSEGEGSGGDSGDGETEAGDSTGNLEDGDDPTDDDLGEGDINEAGDAGSPQYGASGITEPPDIEGKQPMSPEAKEEAGRLLAQDSKEKDMMDKVKEVIAKASKQQMMTDRQRHYTHPEVRDVVRVVKPKP